MKTILRFLEEEQEFMQLLIFQGRYGGAYGLIIPHVYAPRVRETLDDGGVGDYELVVKLENLLLTTSNYPGAKGDSINEIISEITEKLQRFESRDIYNYLSKHVERLLTQ